MEKRPCTDCSKPVSSRAEKCTSCGKLTILGQVDQFFGIELFLMIFMLAIGSRAI